MIEIFRIGFPLSGFVHLNETHQNATHPSITHLTRPACLNVPELD